MSNPRKKLSSLMSAQGGLFDNSLADGALDIRLAFRDQLSREISKGKLSRWQIAAEISRLSGRDLSKDMLDKCTSSNFDYGIRAEDLSAIIYVLGSLEPARVLFDPIHCELIDPRESKLIKLARLEKKKSEINSEIAALNADLGIKK